MPDPVPLLSLVRRALLGAAICTLALPAAAEVTLEDALVRSATSADPAVIRLAVAAVTCASQHDQRPAGRLAVIDYSRPSTKPRLWVFDLARRRLLYTELVAHGRNSGDNYARTFSNAPGSYESSLGLFRTRDTYHGHNGYSMRMEGLESGFNDRAAERAIVMHGAPYVNGRFLRTQGRLGRSQGCPAVRPAVARALIDTMKDGQYVFAYYPDPKWLASSAYLQCATPQTAAPDPAFQVTGAAMMSSASPQNLPIRTSTRMTTSTMLRPPLGP